jgi:hypothetical protein
MKMNKTNTISPEVPAVDKHTPARIVDSDIFSELTKDEELYNKDFDGFMSKAQQMQDSGKFREAFGMYEIAEMLTERDKPEKVALITFKMAESLHGLADSGTESNEASHKLLDDAEMWLNISDNYREAAAENKDISEIKEANSQSDFDEAQRLYDLARNSHEDIRTVRLPLLDEAEKKLNEHDKRQAVKHGNNGHERYSAPFVKRGIRLGARAVLRTIKSTLNRRS